PPGRTSFPTRRSSDLQLLVAHFEERAFHGEGRPVFGDQLVFNSPRTETGNVFRLAPHQRQAGAHGVGGVMHRRKSFPITGPARQDRKSTRLNSSHEWN